MIAALLLGLTQAPTSATRIEVPLAEFATSDAAFTCMGGAFPTIGIDYDREHRRMDFNQGGDEAALFVLDDPVRSVLYDRAGDTEVWIISAQGPARQASGAVAENAPVSILLTVRRTPAGGSADFFVRSGGFSVRALGCRPIPSRRHGPLRTTE
jgi:hypothetical protein